MSTNDSKSPTAIVELDLSTLASINGGLDRCDDTWAEPDCRTKPCPRCSTAEGYDSDRAGSSLRFVTGPLYGQPAPSSTPK